MLKNAGIEKLKKHHHLLMLIGCLLPLALIAAGSFLGWSRSAFLWIFLLLCPLTHFWMMKEMHKPAEQGKTDEHEKAKGGTPSCH